MIRRRGLLGGMLLAPALARAASARHVRVIVSSPAGTAPDLAIRTLRPQLDAALGQTVVVENRNGANGLLAVETIVREGGDGQTFLVTPAGTLTANPHLYPRSGTKALTELTPVTTIGTIDFTIAARRGLGVDSLAALLQRMREVPDATNVATTARGSFPNLAAEMLRQQARVSFNVVPTSGGAEAGTVVAGGHADVVIETLAVLNPLIKAGLLVPLATTSRSRGSLTPELPTVSEHGLPDYAIEGWIAVAATRASPLPQRQTMQAAIASVLSQADVRDRLQAMNFTPVGEDVGAAEQRWRTERERLGQVIRTAGITLE